jgi:hypothetical protein
LDAVYGALLERSPTDAEALRLWRTRGVEKATVLAARFGATSAQAARAAVSDLGRRFGREALLSVPGFFENARGELSFTLVGRYALIPYHDRDGRIATVEGRALTRHQERATTRYVSLRDSGNHLYLFPGHDPGDLDAFCEGPVGAVAAQEGARVAAIKGMRSYGTPEGGPLPELEGAHFCGRVVPYVPDADYNPPGTRLEAAARILAEARHHARAAARVLTVPHGGAPALSHLPPGHDLDAWLVSLPKAARAPALRILLRSYELVGARDDGATDGATDGAATGPKPALAQRAGPRRPRVGVPVHGPLVERAYLRRLGHSPRGPCLPVRRIELRQGSAGQEHVRPLPCEGAGDGARNFSLISTLHDESRKATWLWRLALCAPGLEIP